MLAPGEGEGLRDQLSSVGESGAKPRRGLVDPHLPQPLNTFPKEAPVAWPCSSSATLPVHLVCTQTCSAQTSVLLLAFALTAFVLLIYFSPRGGICKLQTAEKHSLGVAQSPKPAQHSCARPPEQFIPHSCVIDLPQSLKSLMAAGTAEPAVGWGTDLSLSLHPCSISSLHVSHPFQPPPRAPFEHQLH